MKPVQVIEYNSRDICLECGRETISRPFLKKSISLDQFFRVLYILFLLFAKLRTFEIDWN